MKGTLKKNKTSVLIVASLFVAGLHSQSITTFQAQWTGLDDLVSPSFSYENRNIALTISEGGDRDGFSIFTSSCDFLYNDDLDWAFHYVSFDKETNQITFMRRFVTPLGMVGYEELVYDLIDWSDGYFHAEHTSEDAETFHQFRVFSAHLGVENSLPERIQLSQNFPNPFNPLTSISVNVDRQSSGALVIFDMQGREIRTLEKGNFDAGNNTFTWNALDDSGTPVPAGVYTYRLFLNGRIITSNKMTLLK